VADPEAVLRLFLLDAPTPALAELLVLLPDVVSTPLGLEIPLRDHRPEEILALCLRLGVTARATRIVERIPIDSMPRPAVPPAVGAAAPPAAAEDVPIISRS